MSEPKTEKQTEEEKKLENEGMYLDAMNQLQKKFDEIEYIKAKLTIQNTELKKEVITAYGLSRVLDNLINNCFEVDMEVVCLSESLRGHLSNLIDDII
tara:strand:- start:257 stop:550 length:294 start_codon:yes stop_codon:yes gene_type:complete